MTGRRTRGDRDALGDRVRRQASLAERRITASRARVPALDRAFVVFSRDRAIRGSLLGCAIAFRLFIWLLPMTLAVAAALGFVEASDDTEHVGEALGVGGPVLTAVTSAARDAEKSRWILLGIAVVGLYSAGTAAVRTVTAVHELVWDMDRRARVNGPLATLTFTGAAIGTCCVAVAFQRVRDAGVSAEVGAAVGMGAAYAALWLMISLGLPHGASPWPRLVPGAIVFGVGTQVLHVVTVVYLTGRLASASELYGGLGVAATVLLGLYLIARLMVMAAVVNATSWIEAARMRRRVRGASRLDGEEPDDRSPTSRLTRTV